MATMLSIIQNYSTDGIINNVPQEELLKALMEISNASQKETKRSKRKSDPNAPKRPTSAYMFWLTENRQDITDTYFSDFNTIENWDIDSKKEYYLSKGLSDTDKEGMPLKEGKPRSVALITTKAGLLWKELDSEDKQPYEDKFKAAQEEYITLKASYRPSVMTQSAEELLQDAPEGWEGAHRGFTINKTVKDEHNRTIKIFKSFTEAIEKAESLGLQCYGITQTKRGYSVRTGILKKCEKSIASWTKMDYESPIKSKRGSSQKSLSEESINTVKETAKEDDDDSDNEMLVQEITVDGKSYYLNEKTNEVYDPESQECLGKYKDGKIVAE
jgi:hypothetical protein